MKPHLGQLLGRLRRQIAPRETALLNDAELVAQFVASRDQAAFAMLVERHGPMVLALCRRRLDVQHEAEHACQATFLVLARRAGSLGRSPSWRSAGRRGLAGHEQAEHHRPPPSAREERVQAMSQTTPISLPETMIFARSSIKSCLACPRSIATRWSCATWKARRSRRRLRPWAGPGRWERAGLLVGWSGCGVGSSAAARPWCRRQSLRRCPRMQPRRCPPHWRGGS